MMQFLCSFPQLLSQQNLFVKQPIAEQFAVEAMPTFLFMKSGDVKDRVVGAMKEELEKKLELQMAQ
jgi:protein-disulfide isomerase